MTEDRTRRDRTIAWGLTWLAYATYYTGRKGFSVAKRTLETDVGISREALGAIDTAYLACYAIGQFVSGFLGDSIGARRLIGWGMLASAAACVGFGASSAAALFVVLFAINGFAQSTGWPGTTRAMAEWTTLENRGSVMAFWATCYQVGGIVATSAAAWLLGNFGWRSTFFGPAVWIAFVALLVLWLLKPAPPQAAAGTDAVNTPEQDAEARRRVRRRVLRSRVLWCYGASYFCIKLIRYSLLFWLPYYLSEGLGYSGEKAGYLSTAFEAGGIVGVIVIGVVSDRLRRFSRALLALAALVLLGVALSFYASVALPGTLVNVVGFALIGATLFGPDSLISGAAAQDEGGRYAAATATGFVNGMGSVGAVLQGTITVFVSETYGWRALFVVFIGLSVVAALSLLPALRLRGDRSEPAVTRSSE